MQTCTPTQPRPPDGWEAHRRTAAEGRAPQGAAGRTGVMMQTLDHDSVSVHIDASPEAVYAIVSDVTRTPEFSPEIVSCTWLDGATGPAVGARFKAINKVPNRPSWPNKPVVTVVEPGRAFA